VRFDPDSGHGLDGHACDHHEKQNAEFSPVSWSFIFGAFALQAAVSAGDAGPRIGRRS
jgi:hypothetical protein